MTASVTRPYLVDVAALDVGGVLRHLLLRVGWRGGRHGDVPIASRPTRYRHARCPASARRPAEAAGRSPAKPEAPSVERSGEAGGMRAWWLYRGIISLRDASYIAGGSRMVVHARAMDTCAGCRFSVSGCRCPERPRSMHIDRRMRDTIPAREVGVGGADGKHRIRTFPQLALRGLRRGAWGWLWRWI